MYFNWIRLGIINEKSLCALYRCSDSMKHTIFLGLGSNLGDREANLITAIDALPPEVEVQTQSPVYQTVPWGYTEQDDFLNQVIEAKTDLSPEELLKYLKSIEDDIGRTATLHWGPREIDIDILFYDDLVMESEDLTIPHPSVHERAFMLVPLADIAADFQHPALGRTITQLASEVDTTGVEPYIEE